ncbi:serine protease [Acidobacteriota bacterium]
MPESFGLKLEWKLSKEPFADIGFAVAKIVCKTVHDQMPELAELFPLKSNWKLNGHIDNDWIAIRIIDRPGSGVPSINVLKGEELEELKSKILPYSLRNNNELHQLLGATWLSFDRFTYVGPYLDSHMSFPHLSGHIIDWLNNIVVPKVLKRNEARIMMAIPSPPQFNIENIARALFVLECNDTSRQGTAFSLAGVGLITCAHVLGPKTCVFKAEDYNHKYPVEVIASNDDIDIAILKTDLDQDVRLEGGSADELKHFNHTTVAGFPNYRWGDTVIVTPGLVIGFRTVHAIRRILTNAPIIAGMSGGPAIDKDNRVIGIAVTGADNMRSAQATEDHGIIPIDALEFVKG